MSAISYLCDERLSSAAQEPSMHAPHMHLPTTYHPSDPGLGCAKARFIQGVWSALKDPKCNMYVCGIYRDIRGWMWHARGPGRTQAAPKHQAAQPAKFLDIEGPRRRFHIAQLRYKRTHMCHTHTHLAAMNTLGICTFPGVAFIYCALKSHMPRAAWRVAMQDRKREEGALVRMCRT